MFEGEYIGKRDNNRFKLHCGDRIKVRVETKEYDYNHPILNHDKGTFHYPSRYVIKVYTGRIKYDEQLCAFVFIPDEDQIDYCHFKRHQLEWPIREIYKVKDDTE